jgi:epoxyqueuosine reductase
MVTDLELTAEPASSPGSCGSCRACQPACPTDAFVAPGVLDSSRCISYLTIEHRGSIPRALRRQMGAWLFGCDLCQTSCPIAHRATRRPIKPETEDFTAVGVAVSGITLPELLSLDEEEFRRRFKSTPLWRPRREGLLRNALIVAANLGRLDCVDAARALLEDPSPVLREAASWCLAELGEQTGAFALKAALQRENEPELKSLMAQDLIRLAAGEARAG